MHGDLLFLSFGIAQRYCVTTHRTKCRQRPLIIKKNSAIHPHSLFCISFYSKKSIHFFIATIEASNMW